MDILKQFGGKINGTLETFDRIIINGYIQPLHSFRLFLYYLIQKNIHALNVCNPASVLLNSSGFLVYS